MRPEQVAIVVADLCRLAHVALEAVGVESGAPPPTTSPRRPLSTPLGSVDAAEQLARLLPTLLDEARVETSPDARQLERTPLPLGAELPRQAHAWASEGGTWFPRHWLRPVVRQAVPVDVLRWLQGVVEQLADAVAAQALASEEHLATLRASEDESLPWAAAHLARAEAFLARRQAARALLGHAGARLQREAGRRVFASSQRPMRWPRGATWAQLDALVREWFDARRAMSSWLEHLSPSTVTTSELPFLYQRWCGLRLLEALGREGWRPHGDPAWAILLGGRCELVHPERSPIELWFEPHIGRRGHPCGLRLSRDAARHTDSLSPDLVVNFVSLDGPESVVLDPTLCTEPSHLEHKGRYLRSLERTEPRFVAGVPLTRSPWRAWAIAPLHRSVCEVLRPSGRIGVVPLVPGGTDAPLHAFLDDVGRRAIRRPHESHPRAMADLGG